jgi:hypothetical protein
MTRVRTIYYQNIYVSSITNLDGVLSQKMKTSASGMVLGIYSWDLTDTRFCVGNAKGVCFIIDYLLFLFQLRPVLSFTGLQLGLVPMQGIFEIFVSARDRLSEISAGSRLRD